MVYFFFVWGFVFEGFVVRSVFLNEIVCWKWVSVLMKNVNIVKNNLVMWC